VNADLRIALVGCGNIGSRHLQAVASLHGGTIIDIVEPRTQARSVAESRLAEIGIRDKIFTWHQSIDELKNESDLVIVATQASGRAELIRQLLERGHSRLGELPYLPLF